ncbi:MAG: carboxymuconolactone decarboxylase family protein [Armatimonadetes bacterium]|nr:carboxymuconolactone decarboxylase family protein [Armatimonadota bacterium]
MQGETDAVVEALAIGNRDQAPITGAERTLLQLVETVTRHAYRTAEADVQAVRDAGWTEEQIAEAVYVTALFAFFNRVADAFGIVNEGYRQIPPFPEETASR